MSMTTGKISGLVVAALTAFFGISAVFGSFYTVDQGERGVLLTNGAVTSVSEPGLGWKFPFIQEVKRISTQARLRQYDGMVTYSKDQQTATMRVSVNYRLPADQMATIYADYGSEEGVVTRLVDTRVYEALKEVFGKFNAVTAIQERSRLNSEIEDSIRSAIVGPVIIESVQIEDISFSDAYERSIEDRMLAEVEVQKLRQNAEREKVQAEIAVTQAQGRADAVRAEAMAQAEAITLRGDAEANAIKARGEALRQNSQLVGLVVAEKWDGVLPRAMLPGSTVPFLDLSKTVPETQ